MIAKLKEALKWLVLLAGLAVITYAVFIDGLHICTAS